MRASVVSTRFALSPHASLFHVPFRVPSHVLRDLASDSARFDGRGEGSEVRFDQREVGKEQVGGQEERVGVVRVEEVEGGSGSEAVRREREEEVGRKEGGRRDGKESADGAVLGLGEVAVGRAFEDEGRRREGRGRYGRDGKVVRLP